MTNKLAGAHLTEAKVALKSITQSSSSFLQELALPILLPLKVVTVTEFYIDKLAVRGSGGGASVC